MLDPVKILEQKIEELGKRLETKIQISLLHKSIQFALSQLLVLNEDTRMIEIYRDFLKKLN